jgi:hypothetical protein
MPADGARRRPLSRLRPSYGERVVFFGMLEKMDAAIAASRRGQMSDDKAAEVAKQVVRDWADTEWGIILLEAEREDLERRIAEALRSTSAKP